MDTKNDESTNTEITLPQVRSCFSILILQRQNFVQLLYMTTDRYRATHIQRQEVYLLDGFGFLQDWLTIGLVLLKVLRPPSPEL